MVLIKSANRQKIPFVFTNGGTEMIAKEDLNTFKTNLNVTDKENEIEFVMLPDTFDFLIEYYSNATEPDRKSLKEDFLIQYVDRMRIITYLPDNILKRIKDKRMLAFGYAESEIKRIIIKYTEDKNKKALTTENRVIKSTIRAERGLTIKKQFGNDPYAPNLIELFDMVNILGTDNVANDIHLMLETGETLILIDAEIIEQEESITNAYVKAIELYRNENDYELHLLVMKRDENYTAYFYYITYKLKDIKLKM